MVKSNKGSLFFLFFIRYGLPKKNEKKGKLYRKYRNLNMRMVKSEHLNKLTQYGQYT